MIGITGGIGSGKSTIARELARRGFTVYDCDQEAKRIVEQDSNVQHAIMALLGDKAYTPHYNTTYVAQRVFSEPELLAQLNSIVHPAVRRDIEQKQPDFVESAILYEAGLDSLCNKVVVVDAPEELRIARTIARDYHGLATPENINKVRARICAQHTHSGDLVLINDGNTPIAQLVEKLTQSMCKN